MLPMHKDVSPDYLKNILEKFDTKFEEYQKQNDEKYFRHAFKKTVFCTSAAAAAVTAGVWFGYTGFASVSSFLGLTSCVVHDLFD